MSEFSTNITIKGLKRDLFAAMIALQEYVKGINDISISCPWCSSVVNGKYKSLIIDEDTTSEEIASFAKPGSGNIGCGSRRTMGMLREPG